MSKLTPLTPIEAKARILTILEDGEVKLSAHLRYERMRKRSININDVRAALTNGEILSAPEWDERHQNWKYRVDGQNLAEEELTVVTIIITQDLKLIIVTAF